ncbi:MAG: Glu/Leu/Phe/Val dehydrogenase [Anaerolineae bacterium]|nr:Glu/Leu/Phe/Val dehydrogenase [Anaerolineae bacterium]
MSRSDRNPFKIAQAQLDQVARIMDLEPAVHQLLRWPRRELHVPIPVRMDDGTLQVFQGYRVQYNDARGPTGGGLHFHPEETIDAVRALAAWMTWKTSVVDIPLGGGRGSVVCNPRELSQGELERVARGYVRALGHYIGEAADVPAPDVDTLPQVAAWMTDEYSAIRSHNRSYPMVAPSWPVGWAGFLSSGSAGRAGAMAHGGIVTIREAAESLGLNLANATVAIQGYGAVAQYAHRRLTEGLGATVVAISDAGGGVYCPTGIGFEEAVAWRSAHGTAGMVQAREWEWVACEAVIELDVDILILAALKNQIGDWNANEVKARIVVELVEGPTTQAADEVLHRKGVYVIPDLMCSAGVLAVSYLAREQNVPGDPWQTEDVYQRLDQKMTAAFHEVHHAAERYHVQNRLGAYIASVGRVAEAMRVRGWV